MKNFINNLNNIDYNTKSNIYKFLCDNQYDTFELVPKSNQIIVNESYSIPIELFITFAENIQPTYKILYEWYDEFLSLNPSINQDIINENSENDYNNAMLWKEFKLSKLNEEDFNISNNMKINALFDYCYIINEDDNDKLINAFSKINCNNININSKLIGSINLFNQFLYEALLSFNNGTSSSEILKGIFQKEGVKIPKLGSTSHLTSTSTGDNKFTFKQGNRIYEVPYTTSIKDGKIQVDYDPKKIKSLGLGKRLLDHSVDAIKSGSKLAGKGIKNGILGTIGLGRMAIESDAAKRLGGRIKDGAKNLWRDSKEGLKYTGRQFAKKMSDRIRPIEQGVRLGVDDLKQKGKSFINQTRQEIADSSKISRTQQKRAKRAANGKY